MAYVLAGGRGSRLKELTDKRAKPAVFFGGKSRIIDFALSNAINSGIRRIGVATQYKAHSLIRHLQRGWTFFRPERNESFDILPASQMVSESQWYLGTADAVTQNIEIINSYGPEYMVILAGDHVYKMDYALMLGQHVSSGADVTVGCLEVPRMEATGFGVMHVDADDRIVEFLEKPADPPGMPDQPEMALASMGIYVFETEFLFDQLRRDADDPQLEPRLRQGHHPLPGQARQGGRAPLSRTPACAANSEKEAYWRDVGTIDAYWEANIDLTDFVPALDLYDQQLADLDLRRDHAAGQVRPRRGRPARHGDQLAGLGRLHDLGQPDRQVAAVHRRARPLLQRAAPRGGAALRPDPPRRAAATRS